MRFLLLEKSKSKKKSNNKKVNSKDNPVASTKGQKRNIPLESKINKTVKYKVKDPAINDLVQKSIEKFGYDLSDNVFLAFICDDRLKFPLDSKHYEAIKVLYDKMMSKELSKDIDFLYDSSLYERPASDIIKTLQLLVAHKNKEWVANHYAEPSIVDFMKFYTKDGKIKDLESLMKLCDDWEAQSSSAYNGPNYFETDKILKGYNKQAGTSDQINYIKTQIFRLPKFKSLFGVREVIKDSILKFGAEKSRNPFLRYALSLTFPLKDTKKYREKFRYLYNMYLKNAIDLDMEVLKNPTLFERSDREFAYTVNVFDTCSTPEKARKYLKNVDVINIDEFMDGNTVKPAGIDKRPGDTIWNKIEEWSEDNEVTPTDGRNKKDTEDLSVDDLRSIMNKYKDLSRNDIQKKLETSGKLKKGTIIYSEYIDKNAANDKDRGFWKWTGNAWERYTTDNTKIIDKTT